MGFTRTSRGLQNFHAPPIKDSALADALATRGQADKCAERPSKFVRFGQSLVYRTNTGVLEGISSPKSAA